MGTLPVRIAVAAVLLATAAFAAILVRRADARVPFEQVLALGRQLDPLSERLAMLETSHAQYAVGNHPLSATDRFATQLRETVAATAVIGPMLQSPEAGRELGAFADATARLAHVDGRAREYLLAGDTARAAREVTGEGQDLLLSMRTAHRQVRREPLREDDGEVVREDQQADDDQQHARDDFDLPVVLGGCGSSRRRTDPWPARPRRRGRPVRPSRRPAAGRRDRRFPATRPEQDAGQNRPDARSPAEGEGDADEHRAQNGPTACARCGRASPGRATRCAARPSCAGRRR
jgi:hypothetical protein